jgi:hypothetical protein
VHTTTASDRWSPLPNWWEQAEVLYPPKPLDHGRKRWWSKDGARSIYGVLCIRDNNRSKELRGSPFHVTGDDLGETLGWSRKRVSRWLRMFASGQRIDLAMAPGLGYTITLRPPGQWVEWPDDKQREEVAVTSPFADSSPQTSRSPGARTEDHKRTEVGGTNVPSEGYKRPELVLLTRDFASEVSEEELEEPTRVKPVLQEGEEHEREATCAAAQNDDEQGAYARLVAEHQPPPEPEPPPPEPEPPPPDDEEDDPAMAKLRAVIAAERAMGRPIAAEPTPEQINRFRAAYGSPPEPPRPPKLPPR